MSDLLFEPYDGGTLVYRYKNPLKTLKLLIGTIHRGRRVLFHAAVQHFEADELREIADFIAQDVES